MPGKKKINDAPVVLDADMAAAALCRRRLSYFVKEFWDEVVGDPLQWNWHLDALCDEIQAVYERIIARQPKAYDLIVNIPPGTSKSTIATIMAPAWSWTRDPAMRHITGSYSERLAIGHAVKSRDIIRSDKFKRYFPEVVLKSDQDNKTDYANTQKGQRFATSIGGSVTGVHAHCITIDDPLNPKQAASAVELTSANEWLDKTLSTRKVDKLITPTILIMQRLATDDPTGHLLEKRGDGIRHVCLPGEVGPQVKPVEYRSRYIDGLLDPVRLNRAALAGLKTELGAAGYAGQIEQLPVPEGGLIWQRWFVEVPDINFPSAGLMQQYGTDWDLAYTKDDENAASAYVTAGKIGGNIYIDDIGWDWLEFPDLIRYMKGRAAPHYVEAKASGKSAKQTLTANGIPAIEVGVKGGSDKIARARMATPVAEAGMVYIRKSLADKLYNDSRQGILSFPRGKYKDLADALAQSLQRLAKKSKFTVANTTEEFQDLDWL